MTKQDSTMLGVLLLGFGGAAITSACVPSEPRDTGSRSRDVDPPDLPGEAPLAIKGTFPPNERRELGSSPALPPREPVECTETIKPAPCKRYRIQLMGNPSMAPALRAKYKAAFGSACYVAAANNTFDCFYKDPQKACDDGVLVPDIYGAAAYDKSYKCQEVKGTKDWWRQVGPDPVIKIDITYQDAPLETSLIDVNGVSTAINGPYRNLPEPPKVKVGGIFDCASGQVGADGRAMSQRNWILEVNRKKHGVIHSDLPGFEYPCDGPGKPMCKEPLVLKDPKNTPNVADEERAEVHHEARRKDLRGCWWGTNSNKNAVVISRKLNNYLSNTYPSKQEVDQVNQVPPYAP